MAIKYVHMPQDDNAQIEQVEREYSTDGRGLAHGVQKDAIQNGFGARATKREAKACETWSMTFDLLKIKGKSALVFWDEGTVGLSGDILTCDEIIERTAEDTLGPDERLGRFLTRFVSGGNVGAGTWGRGKLIFQAASKSTSILIDSWRDDGAYVALDRRIMKGLLQQPEKPYEDEAARTFIEQRTGGSLLPLDKPGTRIAILDVNDEIIQAFEHSFSDTRSVYRASLAHMIEGTWWEIIHRFNARIYLRHGDKSMQVGITDPLSAILKAKDGEEGIRVHAKKNLEITAGGKRYRIKELRLVVTPGNLENGFRDIWVQRKRMKIGSMFRIPEAHPKILKRLAGYVVLEPALENVVEQAEGLTHYSFDVRKTGIKQIRDAVKGELRKFERKLGLVSVSQDATARNRMLDSMKELNELACELGLVTHQDVGGRQSVVSILLQSMQLPDSNSLRVEIGDTVGPLVYDLRNTASVENQGTFRVVAKQTGGEPMHLFSQACELSPESRESLTVPPFEVSPATFRNGQALRLQASFIKVGSPKVLARCTRTLYVGMDEPEAERRPVALSLTARFPRSDTRRVERAEVLRRIRLRVTNNRPHEISIDLVANVRHMENPKTGRLTSPLKMLHEDRDLVLGPSQDYEAIIDDVPVSPEVFGSVFDTVADVSERTCDLHAIVRLAQASPELGKPRKWKLDQVSAKFYLEVDPPGHSIFRNVEMADAPLDPRQSWYAGSIDSGYDFFLNVGHTAFKFIDSVDSESLSRWYCQEQMLRQGYLIAFENQVFKGPAKDYESAMRSGELSPKEVATAFEVIVGAALNQIQR